MAATAVGASQRLLVSTAVYRRTLVEAVRGI